MVSSMELDNLASSSSRPIRSTGARANDEDEEDERARMLSRTELDSEDDNDEDGMQSLRRDLEKMEHDDEDDGSVESMVRKAVPTTDDPSLPTLTFRVIVLGSIFCIIGASTSQLFFFKSNPPNFSSFFVILSSYPLGNAMARFLPNRRVRFLGELNPGPFSIKEHLLVGVFASSGGSAAYASDILAILSLYYKTELGAIAGVTLLLTTQLIGFSLSGMLQDLLVKPAAMYWPSSLVVVTLYHVLHSSSALTATRLRFFLIAFSLCFIYQFLPGFIFPTLTSLPVLCLISNPTPEFLATIGSGYEGLGFLDFSFDWGAVGSSGLLYTPWWALKNYFAGLILMVWVITPLMYFGDFWDARSFPSAVGAGLFSSNFTHFDVNAVLTPSLTLNETAFETAGPLLLTPYFAITYALSFASLTSVVTHVYLFHGEEIKKAFSKRKNEEREGEDVHNRLMRVYGEVPRSWYIAMFTVNLAASAALVLFTPALQTPLWSLLLSLLIAVIFVVPVGVVAAVSGTTVGLNVITEFVHGFLQPGRPIGNVFFKCFGYMCSNQALSLTADLKIALYLKPVPYKDMFIAQVLGTIVGALVNYYTLVTVIDQKRPFLDGTLADPSGQWTGRAPAVFFSASVIWGLISPARFFAGKYWVLYLGFPLGVAVPYITYRLHLRFPGRGFDKVVFPIICSGATLIPQLPSNVILTSFLVAVFFHVYVARRYPRWFDNYTLTLSAALDAATSLSAMGIYVLFTALFSTSFFVWWGNPAGDSEHCKVE
ncbi:OPT oligopeptide transporter protein-domain-containing protein [Mrakia frigida]|uniref:OPT oligopeptide transporter protein-domain-containing protein n=1 Tax=Mrakia frigida TaxID=29902 RepID=UPI003FCC0007